MSVEVSIVIRVLNEAKHLESLLKGIYDQNHRDWEIVLVDSGSTDGSMDIARRYGADIHHIPKEEFTFGRSLNLGCQRAQGRYLVFASGHVCPVTNSWLRNLIRPFEDSTIAMVYGRQRGTDANRLSELRDLDTYYGPTSSILVDEPKGNNGNAAIRRDLWLDQPFDESLPGLEDIDWAQKIQRKGHRVYYAADAAVYHVHEESLGQVYRRHLREATAHKRMFPDYRLTLANVAKGAVYFTLRDFMYAFREGKPGKVFQVPGTRLAEYVGIYNGIHHQSRLNRDVTSRLKVPETYRRVVVHGPDRHDLEHAEVPELKPDDVLIQVAYVGVCATDVEVAKGTLSYYRNGSASYPIVPGHEYSGIIVRTSKGPSNLRPGQKVVGECAVGCDRCVHCTAGEYYRCAGRDEVGVVNRNGAYADYLVMPSSYVHKLPVQVPLKHGALVEPIAVCLKGLRKLEVQKDHTVCVVGAGPIGNICAQILRSRGLSVTVVDRDARRLDLLHKYDADTLTELAGIEKFDYLVEATGNEGVIPYLVEKSKPSAKLLLLGLPYTRPVEVAFDSVTSYDKEIYGSVASQRRDWEEAIRLVDKGVISLDDHTSVVEPLEDYQKVWEGAGSRRDFKVLLSVSKDLQAL